MKSTIPNAKNRLSTTSKFFGVSLTFLTFVMNSSLKAQRAETETSLQQEKKKLVVDMQITPSEPGFKAGFSLVDSALNKVKLWACNSNREKCQVTIRNSMGIVWSGTFREAYYSQVYDLSSLDDGEYAIRVSNGKENFEKKILIHTHTYVIKRVRLDSM